MKFGPETHNFVLHVILVASCPSHTGARRWKESLPNKRHSDQGQRAAGAGAREDGYAPWCDTSDGWEYCVCPNKGDVWDGVKSGFARVRITRVSTACYSTSEHMPELLPNLPTVCQLACIISAIAGQFACQYGSHEVTGGTSRPWHAVLHVIAQGIACPCAVCMMTPREHGMLFCMWYHDVLHAHQLYA